MAKLLAKKKNSKGFTLSETLVTVLIMVMVFSVVAAGIPVAISVLNKIIDTANAQLLMSTTMIRLRDELGKAENVTISGTAISFMSSDGTRRTIDYVPENKATAENPAGIHLKQTSGLDDGTQLDFLLVSNAAANKNLHMTYEIKEAYSGGVLTISNLTVLKGSKKLFTVDDYKIRVLSDVSE